MWSARSPVSGEVEHSLETIPVVHSKWTDTACRRQKESQKQSVDSPSFWGQNSKDGIRNSKEETCIQTFTSSSKLTDQAAASDLHFASKAEKGIWMSKLEI